MVSSTLSRLIIGLLIAATVLFFYLINFDLLFLFLLLLLITYDLFYVKITNNFFLISLFIPTILSFSFISFQSFENLFFLQTILVMVIIFSNKYKKDEILKINIAHNEGNYFTNSNHLNELKKENLIAFKYCDEKGYINEETNPNGSLENIAGIYNQKKNILGMMPHPERMVDEIISNKDGINLFSSLLN